MVKFLLVFPWCCITSFNLLKTSKILFLKYSGSNILENYPCEPTFEFLPDRCFQLKKEDKVTRSKV